MNALALTLQDLRSTLSRAGLQTQLKAMAEREARELSDRLSDGDNRVDAQVVGMGEQISIELSAPDLWDREFGTSEREGEAGITRALIERDLR